MREKEREKERDEKRGRQKVHRLHHNYYDDKSWHGSQRVLSIHKVDYMPQ